jgi:acetyl esterase/lipase
MSSDLIARLDPELRVPIAAAVAGEAVSLDDIPAARAGWAALMEALQAEAPLPYPVDVEELVVPGPGGAPGVRVKIWRPRERRGPLPALLWVHGGGYVLGGIDHEDPVCARLATEAECAVVAVEYRLAPECPFPGPLEDCYAALRWMAGAGGGQSSEIDGARLAIGGASAGGGLAAGLALLARDRAEVAVAFQLLLVPMLDDRNVAPPSDSLPDALLWTRAANLAAWRAYLGCEPGSEGVSCHASPARAATLEGLPAAYVAVGDLDLFALEDVDYARRLIAAGVSTELHVYPGACHGFDLLAPEAEISRRFNADISRALRRALHPERLEAG